MRFKLTLQIDKKAFGNRLPLNYQYASSALIYKILAKSGTEFSTWLHENGFKAERKKFKLFTFSRIQIPRYHIEDAFIRILSDTATWQISFLPERSTQEFIQGLFKEQAFELGVREANIRFYVQRIELLPPPPFQDTMTFETLSPSCIVQKNDEGKEKYLSPDNPDASRLVKINLLGKYKAFTGNEFSLKDFPFKLKTLTPPKSVLICFKQGTPQENKIRGYMYRFSLTAPLELMKIAYETGIGSKNSQGFGCVKETEIKRVTDQ